MRTHRSKLFVLALVVIALAATASAAPKISALRVIPGDSAAVGMVKLSELRSSPLSGRIFNEADKMTCDGDGAKFLAETGLDPAKDIDTITFALRPNQTTKEGDALVVAEGRFDSGKIITAMTSHGAKEVSTPHGKYYLIEDKDDRDDKAAVAFLGKGYAVMGTEEAVKGALNAVARGGSGFPDSTLGQQMGRIDASASAWMLADVQRLAQVASDGHDGTQTTQHVFAAVKKMSYVSMWTTDAGDALRFGGTALSDDEETRGLVEDTIRGALSAARLAAQEKDPELMELLRKVEVKRDREGVSVEATIPAAMLERFREKAKVAGGVSAAR